MEEDDITNKEDAVKDGNASISNKFTTCTICKKKFSDFQSCLEHETYAHTRKIPKAVNRQINRLSNAITDSSVVEFHSEISAALKNSVKGEELNSIFKLVCLNSENLSIVNERIKNDVMNELKTKFDYFVVDLFGSVATGLALKDCDIDIHINLGEIVKTKQMYYFNKLNSLIRRSEKFSDVYALRSARVPIVKCKHTVTGFSIDINISAPNSLYNTQFLRDVLKTDNRLYKFVLFVKFWAKNSKIVRTGYWTSYSLIILALFYLQQPYPDLNGEALFPPLSKLQNAINPVYVEGVNYAYDKNCFRKLPTNVTTIELIKGFFSFYNEFDFTKNIIAPYLGTPIDLDAFKEGKFKYTQLTEQLNKLSEISSKVYPLQVDRSVIVQDPFCLNRNITSNVSFQYLKFLKDCISYAHTTCIRARTNDAQMLEALICNVVKTVTNQMVMTFTKPTILKYNIKPSRAELRFLADYTKTTNAHEIYNTWVNEYTAAIMAIFVEIFKLHVVRVSGSEELAEDSLETTHLLISGTVDLWSGRSYQCFNNETYFDTQMQQTDKLYQERSQNNNFAVNLKAIVNIVAYKNDGIEIEAKYDNQDEIKAMSKKDALRKLFQIFKCNLQQFNLKQYLKK
ncbi:poly(A) RNA polymerase, mitochondrial [Teleopsis dalmanni]|uniref:poly(A) RNA polymerase, mitochondrial n=1 Tax=Teleopsis dalmanni TaxID=139649 RepID=UPI0018CE113D|nr:poly(A) RNA polymerase, mitochondrial [Teleopsis dalmanni]